MLYGTVYYIYGNIYAIKCIYNGNRLKSICHSYILHFDDQWKFQRFHEFSQWPKHLCRKGGGGGEGME